MPIHRADGSVIPDGPRTQTAAGGTVIVTKERLIQGKDGQNAYTLTTFDFVQPASGDTVDVSVMATSWMGVGQSLLMPLLGSYTVDTIVSSTIVRLRNDNLGGGAAEGETIPKGTNVVVTGAGGTGGGAFTPINVDGAVQVESPAGVITVRRLRQTDIDPGFAIASFTLHSPAQGTYERGQTIAVGSSPQAQATYVSGPPSSGSITNSYGGSSGGGDINLSSWTFNVPFASATAAGSIKRNGTDGGADPTWTATLSATRAGITVTSAKLSRWTLRIFWGGGLSGGSETVDEAFAASLAGTTVQTDALQDMTLTLANQWVYQIIPAGYAVPNWTLSGFPVPKSVVATFDITNQYGVVNSYKAIRSDERLTGTALNILVTA